jgi:hypothetical protein
MMGDSLRRQPGTRASLARIPFKDAFIALKKTVHRIDRFIVPSVEQIACPKCHWKCAHRSRRRRGLDSVLALFWLHPYRCRSCHRRYYRRSL